MSEGSWYKTGFGGIKNEEERLAQQYGVPRFWLKKGSKTKIVFLDDEPACIHEHSPKINGSWQNWFTCLKDVYPDDPACCSQLGHDSRSYVGYFTIMDLTEWKDAKGNVHNYQLKLFGAKLKTLKLLQSKKEDRDNRLAGRIYKVQRTDENSPGVGNDFEYDSDVENWEKMFAVANYKGKKLAEMFKSEKPEDIEKVKRLFQVKTEGGAILPRVVPFNYYEVLKPKTPREMKDALRGVKIETDDGYSRSGSTSSGESGGSKEDDVPF